MTLYRAKTVHNLDEAIQNVRDIVEINFSRENIYIEIGKITKWAKCNLESNDYEKLQRLIGSLEPKFDKWNISDGTDMRFWHMYKPDRAYKLIQNQIAKNKIDIQMWSWASKEIEEYLERVNPYNPNLEKWAKVLSLLNTEVWTKFDPVEIKEADHHDKNMAVNHIQSAEDVIEEIRSILRQYEYSRDYQAAQYKFESIIRWARDNLSKSEFDKIYIIKLEAYRKINDWRRIRRYRIYRATNDYLP